MVLFRLAKMAKGFSLGSSIMMGVSSVVMSGVQSSWLRDRGNAKISSSSNKSPIGK